MPKISIVIPIYNVERYLPRCLDSILCQTLVDWECILVDDGSTDKSGDICDMYSKKDSRIITLHKKNGGVGSARNMGLDIASGEWITFIDADDYIDENFFSVLYSETISQPHTLLITSPCMVVKEQIKTKRKWNNPPKEQTTKEYLECLLARDSVSLEVWGKLYRRSAVKNIRFDVNIKIGEDWLFLVSFAFDNINKGNVVNLSSTGYNYFIREDSAMRVIGNDVKNAECKILELIKRDRNLVMCFNTYLLNKCINKIIRDLKKENKNEIIFVPETSVCAIKHLRKSYRFIIKLSTVLNKSLSLQIIKLMIKFNIV